MGHGGDAASRNLLDCHVARSAVQGDTFLSTSGKSGDPMKRTFAFTLLELLIVIAITMILAALILTATAKVKDKARSVECLSRQKQWTMAFLSYADEHEGDIPREGYGPFGEVVLNNWSQVVGFSRSDGTSDTDDVWYNALPRYLSLPKTSYYQSP